MWLIRALHSAGTNTLEVDQWKGFVSAAQGVIAECCKESAMEDVCVEHSVDGPGWGRSTSGRAVAEADGSYGYG